ncbi:hypothetical protein N4R57_12940 [Rhodobacteraceae bacterium D3-12]|nr:hypothetical protein N4R57_12940 [Rhodobacteraceae bacterium D3-12]
MFARLFSINPYLHAGATLAAFGAFQVVKGRLDASYAASRHPVDYATGQLAFDAEKIEGFYGVMQEAGTLEVYWRTQIIDFGFIATVMVLALLLGTLVARLSGAGHWGRRVGVWAAVTGMAGAAMDAVENLLSFAMLARPDAISQTLAMTYSSAAAVKFALLTLAMVLIVAALILSAVHRIRGRV